MFKNKRSLQVSLVKTPNDGSQVVETASLLGADDINAIALEQGKNLTKAVCTVILVKKAADTVSELILIGGRKYI